MKINFAKIINKNIKQNKKEFSISKQKIIFFIIFLINNYLNLFILFISLLSIYICRDKD
jgi:hypothetical protein